MIAVAFALPIEARPVIRRGGFSKRRCAGYTIYRGGIGGTDAVLFSSGVGAERAYEAASRVIPVLRPSLYISAGLCGSISPDAGTGDVFVADGILSFKEGNFGRVYGPEDGLTVPPVAAGIEHVKLICSDRIQVTAVEKASLLERRPGASIVDMESEGAARAARDAGVPFMAVKAVSDGHEENLPVDFNRFTKSTGEMDMLGLVMHVLIHPSTIGPLMKLSRNSKNAAQNLAAGLTELIPLMADTLP